MIEQWKIHPGLSRREFFGVSYDLLQRLFMEYGPLNFADEAKKTVAASMHEEVGSPTRKSLESWGVTLAYLHLITDSQAEFGRWRVFEEILCGLGCWEPRMAVMDALYQIRQRGFSSELPSLSSERVRWAENHKVDPAVLAYCCQAYPIARRITGSSDGLMISSGGLAKLLMTETSLIGADGKLRGFINIGAGSAWEEINATAFPEERPALIRIAEKLTDMTGLPFNANGGKNIPGSERGDPRENATGGAIALQMRPTNVEAFWWEEDPEKGIVPANPFHPLSSPIFAWRFLEYCGFNRKNQDKIRRALLFWNQDFNQAQEILTYHQNYLALFPEEETDFVPDQRRKNHPI